MKKVNSASAGPVVLALGGGAARGWAHVGVISYLQEAGFDIRGVAGTSIGALVGAFLAADEFPVLRDELAGLRRRDLLRFLDPVVGGDGLLGGDAVLDFIAGKIPVACIEGLSLPFAAVAVDLVCGEEVVFKSGSLKQAVRASISIPGVFSSVHRNGRVLVDGGLANPVPVSVARRLVPGIPVCAVDLNGHVPASFSKAIAGDTASPRHPWFALPGLRLKCWLRRLSLKTVFPLASASLVVIEQQLTRARLQEDPPDLYIKPDLTDIELADFHKAESAMAAGYAEAKTVINV